MHASQQICTYMQFSKMCGMKGLVICMLVVSLSAQSEGLISPQPKPLVKVPEGSTTTGHHIVVLKDDTSKDELHDVMEKVKRMSEDVTVHRYTEHVGKTLTLNAPDHVLDKVCTILCLHRNYQMKLIFNVYFATVLTGSSPRRSEPY